MCRTRPLGWAKARTCWDFDTERSTDHGWGPRLQLLVDPANVATVSASRDERLPETFRGWPVRFGWDDVPVTHYVEVDAPGGWFESTLVI